MPYDTVWSEEYLKSDGKGKGLTMDKSQIRHARATADKVKTHLLAMEWAMDTLTEEKTSTLESVSVEIAKEQFGILEHRWECIQAVLRDMMPELE